MQCMKINRLLLLKSAVIQKSRQLGHVMFNKYLLLTNAGISMSLSAAGDVIQQHYEIMQKDKKVWEPVRTRNMSVSGLTVGIVCHYTYHFLDKALPGRSLRIVMKKVVVDQLLFSPMYISVFFLTLALLEDSSWKTFCDEIINKGWRLYAAEWMIWPPAQVVNFYFLPTRFRVLYDNTISLGFDVYTSYIKHNITIKEENTCEQKF